MRLNVNEVSLRHLRRAIAAAQAARDHGNHPFGAILVSRDGQVLAEAENTVLTERDPTGHAELNLVRISWARYDPQTLAESTLFSSTEPCAMCAGAIFWSGIGKVVFALSEEGLYATTGPEIANDAMKIPCRQVFASSGRQVQVEGPALEEEAKAPHSGFWDQQSGIKAASQD
jgi:tRNA(Arg) A34 adenosine deaminase TadA